MPCSLTRDGTFRALCVVTVVFYQVGAITYNLQPVRAGAVTSRRYGIDVRGPADIMNCDFPGTGFDVDSLSSTLLTDYV